MLDEIRPADFGERLQTVLHTLDEATRARLRSISKQAQEGTVDPNLDLNLHLHALLEEATFTPPLPLQAWGTPTTPASQKVAYLGPVASAAQARQLAAEHYSLLGPEEGGDAGQVAHLTAQLILVMDVAPTPQFSACLPGDYTHDLRPSWATGPGPGLGSGRP